MHKRYCVAPVCDKERIAALKEHGPLHMIPGLTWENLCESVDQDPENPSDVDAIVDKLEALLTLMNGAVPEKSGPQYPFYDQETQTFDDFLPEIKATPVIMEGLCFSWTCMGTMDRKTGELQYTMNSTDLGTGQVRQMTTIDRKPTRDDLWQLIYGSITKPMPSSGERGRPKYILFAHRWGDELTAPVRNFIQSELGILCELETRSAAISSAKQHNTDPDGYNFP